MAFPTILVNSATGSDTAASGAGPSTALTGTAASYVTSVVTLDGTPNLSGVATDGSHVLYLVTSTGVRFFKITAKDDTLDTVTVTPNPAGTSTGLTWAIGGKRASIGSASSRLLFDQGGSDGDAKAGWTVEMQSGHTETTTRFDIRVGGIAGTGFFALRGSPGAATLPVITFTGDEICFVQRNAFNEYSGFEIRNTNGSKTASIGIYLQGSSLIKDMVMSHPTDKLWNGITLDSGQAVIIRNCLVANCAGIGIRAVNSNQTRACFLACNIHDCGSHGISLDGGIDTFGCIVSNCLVWGNGGDGIYIPAAGGTSILRSLHLLGNTIHDNAGDGIEITNDPTANDGNIVAGMLIVNNQITNNGGYGLKFSSGSASAINLDAVFTQVINNNTYNNTSGAYLPTGYGTDDPGLDPDFANAAAGDFTPQNPALEGTAFPTLIP